MECRLPLCPICGAGSPWHVSSLIRNAPRPRGKPSIDFIFAPSDAAITQGNWLGKFTSLYLPPQVIAAIIYSLLRFEPVKRDQFQRHFLRL
jgi:hypothetical protein